MNNRTPRNERDHVLVDVKAKPSGWPMASLDPDSGRGPRATSGMPAPRDPTKSGLYGFRGLPLGFGAHAAQLEQLEAAKPFHAEQLGIEVEDAELLKEAHAVG